jgi:hypothetical protein
MPQVESGLDSLGEHYVTTASFEPDTERVDALKSAYSLEV